VKITGYNGPLIGINNVTGIGLDGAATIDPPKIPEPVAAKPHQLRLDTGSFASARFHTGLTVKQHGTGPSEQGIG
jgi:hypothetical protein